MASTVSLNLRLRLYEYDPKERQLKAQRRVHSRPADLAAAHGITAQTVRNYESSGVLPAAARTATGYRVYSAVHAAALDAYLALIPGFGYPAAGTIMRAVNRGDPETAFRAIDAGHAQLIRDRETLDTVETAVGVLIAGPAIGRPDRPLPIGAVAHRLGVTAATLRKWERAGILEPPREGPAGHRAYRATDVRDAELAHLLRRGGYPLAHIVTVLRHVRTAGGPEPLAASLADWRRRLTARSRAMLAGAARLDAYLREVTPAEDRSAAG
jgi:DNA-binding transcriptional MerR regulator